MREESKRLALLGLQSDGRRSTRLVLEPISSLRERERLGEYGGVSEAQTKVVVSHLEMST